MYGWLNEQIPYWDKTIGKVIDEENVLFRSGLNPKKISKSDLSFYGIQIDLDEVEKTVKTVADYENEKADYKVQIQSIQQSISNLNTQLNDELERLTKKFHTKIRELKEIIQTNEYTRDQNKSKLERVTVQLDEYRKNADSEKKTALEKIETEIGKASEELIKANAEVIN